MQKYNETVKNQLKIANAIFLVMSLTDKDSYNEAKEWMDYITYEDNFKGAKIVVLANKSDKNSSIFKIS